MCMDKQLIIYFEYMCVLHSLTLTAMVEPHYDVMNLTPAMFHIIASLAQRASIVEFFYS